MVLAVLIQELTALMDNESPSFVGFPENNAVMADNWSSAVNAYAKDVIPPSTTAAAAKTAMEGVLQGVSVGTGIAVFQSAYTAYAAQLALGMQPAFTGTPPPSPIDLTPVYNLPYTTPISQRVSAMATIVDTWFRTGIAVNNSSGASIPWA